MADDDHVPDLTPPTARAAPGAALAVLDQLDDSKGDVELPRASGQLPPAGEPTPAGEPVRRKRGRPTGSRTSGRSLSKRELQRRAKALREQLAAAQQSAPLDPPLSAPVQAPPAPVVIDPEERAQLAGAMAGVSAMVFVLIAARRGDHWKLTQEEAASLGTAAANAFAPYLGALSDHLPLLIFGGALFGTVLPRMRADRDGVASLPQSTPASATG